VTVYLLDANVLVALAWPEHGAYERASRWFARHARLGWATSPMTQAGLVRVLSNPAFSERALTVAGALQVLRRNVAVREHQFWTDAISVPEAMERMPTALSGHQQITDAYLVALAMHNKGKLATFDRGIQRWAPPGSVELVG
jgi:toxin-antitoxin system PIN domain toxin